MTRASITIKSKADRDKAARWAHGIPDGSRIEFKSPRRSLLQNEMMWSLLTDVAAQKEHCGRKYTADQWKVLMLHACGREVQFVPSLDGSTFIPWGQSSSDLSKQEMTELIEFVLSWGAQNGVIFQDPIKEIAA